MGNSLRQQLSVISDNFKTEDRMLQLSDIFKGYLNNYKNYHVSNDKIYDLLFKEAIQWLEKSFPNSKKILSKRNRYRLANKKFMLHIKEQNTYILAKVTNPESFKRIGFKVSTVTPMSTSKGLIYFLTERKDLAPQEYLVVTAITSHVFDRYSERCYDSELSRLEAIQTYYLEQYPGWILRKDLTYIKPTKKGISLGDFMLVSTPENTLVFLFEKTFITNDMVRPDQEKCIFKSLKNFALNKSEEDEIYLP